MPGAPRAQGAPAPAFVPFQSFEQLAASTGTTVNLTGRGDPERVVAARVSGNYFEAFFFSPRLRPAV